jgi:hypothetical protein
MKIHSKTPSSLFRPAVCDRFHFLVVYFMPKRLLHKVRSRLPIGYRL